MEELLDSFLGDVGPALVLFSRNARLKELLEAALKSLFDTLT